MTAPDKEDLKESVTFRLWKNMTARLRSEAEANTRTISGELEVILEKHFKELNKGGDDEGS